MQFGKKKSANLFMMSVMSLENSGSKSDHNRYSNLTKIISKSRRGQHPVHNGYIIYFELAIRHENGL